jgi:hypothetical protein
LGFPTPGVALSAGQRAGRTQSDTRAVIRARFGPRARTGGSIPATLTGTDDLPIMPAIIVADAPKPRRLSTIREARDYVDEPTRLGRLAP